jgi:hypothetical protein
MKKALILALALAGATVASAEAQVIVSCTGVFCSAPAPLAPNLGGTGQNNFASTGVPLWTSGVYSVLGTSGIGNVLRATSPTIGTSLTLSYAAGSGARCLHVDNAGAVTIAGADCGAGGGGTPGGSNTQVQFNNSGSFGGITGFTTNGTVGTFAANALNISGATSGTSILNAPATGGGTATLFAGTDTIVGLAATQTLTNKTISGASNTFSNIALSSLASQAADTVVMNATGGSASPTALAVNNCANALTYSTSTHAFGCNTGGGTGTVTTLTAGAGINFSSGATCTTTCTINLANALNEQTGTTYTVLSSDAGKLVSTSNASSIAVTLPQATGSFASGFGYNAYNYGAGVATVTPTTSTIAGKTSLPLGLQQGASFFANGAGNYGAIMGMPQVAQYHLLGSTTTGNTYPVDVTVSALLDGAFSSSQGAVLYRDSSGWAALAPGTSGNFLKTQGAGANPVWAAASGSGTVTTLTAGTNITFSSGSTCTTTCTINATGGGGTSYTAAFTGNVSGTPSTGLGLRLSTATFTDNNTAGSGTAALFPVHLIAAPTIAASNTSVTTTHASTLRIAGVPITGTNETVSAKTAFSVAAGPVSFEDPNSDVYWYQVGGPGQANTEFFKMGWDLGANIMLFHSDASGTGTARDVWFDNGGTAGFRFNTAGTDRFEINGDGSIYLNLSSDAGHTDRTVCRDTGDGTLMEGSGTLGVCLGTSSRRYKNSIVDLAPGLAELMKLRAVSFHYNNATYGDPKKEMYGFIAEEAKPVLPQLVGLDKEGRPNTFDYGGLVPILVKAVQQQQSQIAALQKQVANDSLVIRQLVKGQRSNITKVSFH